MDKFGTSQSVKRVEDVRFLTGDGRYVDDIAPEGALHAYFLRSTQAHGDIATLDVSEAETMPGVHMVLTADRLAEAGLDINMPTTTVPNRDGSNGAAPDRPLLARGRVRFVGEAVAAVIADSYIEARDAAEAIELDIEERPVHIGLSTGGEPLHDEAPDNLAFDWAFGDEQATRAVFDGAAHVVTLDIDDNRIIVNSMEPRGCYAETEADGRLHVCVNGQGVWGPKAALARTFRIDPSQVRVTTPDVGGGFGMKGMDYPETFCVAHAARSLGRPVRWIADRTESMLSDNAGRDLTSTASMAFDENHKLIAYRVDGIANMGAYNSQYAQPIQTELALKVLTGCYDVQQVYFNMRGVFTNTTQVDAYRGAGRPEAIYVLERAMDYAARELGLDPWELRRINFIPAAAFPYVSASGETYDVGDFHKVLASAERAADLDGFAARRRGSEARGQLRGIGLCYYIESILGDPSEGAAVEFNDDGSVTLYVGTQSNGQGHETVYPQILHEYTGIPHDCIHVVQGDSDRIAKGGGTGGSRSVTTQGTVTRGTATRMKEAFAPFLAQQWDVEQVDFQDGAFRAPGSNRTLTMIEAADLARRNGRTDLLRFDHREELPGRSYPNGAHVCEVEIDPETGHVSVPRYTVVDDFGVLMNPMLAEGQVHGGVVQGIGQAINERVVHDADGQLLTATFMDYGMPRASELPMFAFSTEPVPSTANPLGMKGCGEAGTVGALAAVANAVLDAVWDRGIRQVDMPFTPNRMWSMINDGTEIAAE
ncbi:xanthine dehydrogenase family protein molybdopterin-binding subunit [Brevirhabdus sp.]|uniref:xanthine dehydrogenase family protein molybdopterin-binding subunit n=1 Tax=Brevirhabdus sp. TaxID=2004514 RepID=UPI00405844BB